MEYYLEPSRKKLGVFIVLTHFLNKKICTNLQISDSFITSITLLCMVGATPDTNKTW